MAYGDAIANAVFNARVSDQILVPGPAYVPGTGASEYQLTSLLPPPPVNTNAPNWMPFALLSASQFRPNGPDKLPSKRYGRDLGEVQAFGGTVSSLRTTDQEQIARWHGEMAQFQLNRIARAETASDGRDLLEHARLFALLNLAMADATTSVFEAKYTFRFWRPVTAIRNADLDDNDNTVVDPLWTPFLNTPPHPEYPAAHAVVQVAGARVLESYFGPRHAFETTSPTVPGVTRSYTSFDDFTDEGRHARILGGMHFRSSLDEGARQGKRVAELGAGTLAVTALGRPSGDTGQADLSNFHLGGVINQMPPTRVPVRCLAPLLITSSAGCGALPPTVPSPTLRGRLFPKAHRRRCCTGYALNNPEPNLTAS